MEKVTIKDLIGKKKGGEKIVMITSYDYISTKIVDDAGVDGILVGDSVGMVLLGYESTLPVTMDEMLHHVKAVVRAKPKALIVADMPFMSYETSVKDALENAGKFMKAGADAVKLEGGVEIFETVSSLVKSGIPVMGHIGLNPQRVLTTGGYRYRGRNVDEALKLVEDAKALEEAGVFSIVLELVYAEVAKVITNEVSVPTIGIGSGPYCDGQIIVLHDILGLTPYNLSFVKRYADLYNVVKDAVSQYREEVRKGIFPGEGYYRSMDKKVLDEFLSRLAGNR